MSKVDLNDFNTSKCMPLEEMFYSSVSAELKIIFLTNSIIIFNRFLKIYEIVIVQNLATRYVTMFLVQKNVPNFKVIKMFVFAYCTTALITIHRAPNIQRN